MLTDGGSSSRTTSMLFLYVARNPDARLRTVADEIGVTERAAHRILTELSRSGYLTITKNGRRNHYRVMPGRISARVERERSPRATRRARRCHSP